jgi:hypothetical protein
MIDVKGIETARLFQELYEHSKPIGMGRLQYVPGPMPIEQAREFIKVASEMKKEARELIKQQDEATKNPRVRIYFDYVFGRVMKVDIGGDEINPALYDRDNGEGAAAAAVAAARLPR